MTKSKESIIDTLSYLYEMAQHIADTTKFPGETAKQGFVTILISGGINTLHKMIGISDPKIIGYAGTLIIDAMNKVTADRQVTAKMIMMEPLLTNEKNRKLFEAMEKLTDQLLPLYHPPKIISLK